MEEVLGFVVPGIVLGLAAGLAPGPLLVLVVAHSVRHGTREGVKVAIAPLITDLPIIGLAILGFLGSMYSCLIGSKMLLAVAAGRSGAVLTSRLYVFTIRVLGVAPLHCSRCCCCVTVFGTSYDLRQAASTRWTVQNIPTAAIAPETGTTTTRCRYQSWSSMPTTPTKAIPTTASWPSSTPALNVTSAVRSSERRSPKSASTPANPIPCSRPKAKTSLTRHGFSFVVTRFFTAT